MDLKEFVTQTLTQIIEGVRGAQTCGKDLSAEVNPDLQTSASWRGSKAFSVRAASMCRSFNSM